MKSSQTCTCIALLVASVAAIHAADNRSEDGEKSRTHLRADAKSKRGIAPEDPYTDIYRTAVERRMQAAATRRNPTRKNVQEEISTAYAAVAFRSAKGRAFAERKPTLIVTQRT